MNCAKKTEYEIALEYIDGAKWFGAEPTLRRIDELLELLGRPQDALKAVHIAGTNGKGSCAAMLASVLRAAGYRVGLFTSPYLFRFNERMQINGHMIEDAQLAQYVFQARDMAERMAEHPTEFELITAVALLYFKAENCDIAVLEAGLGGSFDATNIISAPECSVIMNIGLDHTAVLGNTVEKIAAEKAGIIKNGVPCVLYAQEPGVENVIKERCEQRQADLRIADFSAIESQFDSIEGQAFAYKGESYALSLPGAHQLKNAAVVLETVEVLREKGWELPPEAVEHGLYSTVWPARFELCDSEPDFIVDGGHNPQCAQAVAESLRRYYPDTRHVLIFGVLRDKDYVSIAEVLAPEADAFVTVAPESPRALSADELKEVLDKYDKPVTACDSIRQAIQTAAELAGEDGMVCAVGSLYLAGSVRYYLGMY